MTGQTRSGKTWLVADDLNAERALLVWDPKGQTGWARDHRCRLITRVDELHAFVLADRPSRVAYSPIITPENFDAFCRLAWVWIRRQAMLHGRRVGLVVDELADVTSPGKAPVAWGEIVRKAMEFRPKIYGITQRPTEADSTLRGNAFLLRTHALPWPRDRKLMAESLDVPLRAIESIEFAKAQYLERDMMSRSLRAGGIGSPRRTLEAAQL